MASGFFNQSKLPPPRDTGRYPPEAMNSTKAQYENFVEHPRFGKAPNVTGLNPDPKMDRSVYFHWHSPRDSRIPNTAIEANRSRQNSGLGYVTHYIDALRKCVDCDRSFIFYAKEQQYWYETLQFNLSANCIRCCDCRKSVRDDKWIKSKHDQLIANDDRTEKQNLELAELALNLYERCGFGKTTLELVRHCLNSIPEQSKIQKHKTYRELSARSKRLLEIDG